MKLNLNLLVASAGRAVVTGCEIAHQLLGTIFVIVLALREFGGERMAAEDSGVFIVWLICLLAATKIVVCGRRITDCLTKQRGSQEPNVVLKKDD